MGDRWLWLALGCALVLRLYALYGGPHPGPRGDEGEYYAAAAVLADGRGLSFVDESLWVRPPLYILFLGGLFRLFGPSLLGVWVVQSLLGLASLVLLYVLARLIYPDPRSARLAVVLAALYWPFAVYARLLLTETLVITLLLGAYVALYWWARRGSTPPLAVAGVLLGLAILTRGLILGFLFLVPAWFALGGPGAPDARARARACLLCLGVALAVVAPWTARNAITYQRLILVETTGGYNLWLAAAGGRGAGQMEAALLAIPNQGDRQTFALRQGIDGILDRPGAYLVGSASELAGLWRLNFSAFERLTQGYSRGLVSFGWLALTAGLDDLVYFSALPLAVLGWLATPRSRDRWLIGLWIGFTCIAGSLFFSITRFRIPLMPFIFVLAGAGLARLSQVGDVLAGVARSRRLGAFAVLTATLLIVYPSFEPALYVAGFRSIPLGAALARGFALLHGGDPRGAMATFNLLPQGFYGRAVGLGLAQHQLGNDNAALAAIDDVADPTGAALVRGTIARDAGDPRAARAIWNGRDFRLRNPLDDAWRWLRPPGVSRLDVGDGLDIGYVRGFSVAEQDAAGTSFRWTGPRAEARLLAPPGGAELLALRVRSYRPAGGAIPPLEVALNGSVVGRVQPTTNWTTVYLPISARGGQVLNVELSGKTFVPGYADRRILGCMVSEVSVLPVAGR